MSENERLRQALEEHKKRHPETEEETLVALGRVLYPKEEQQRGSHALHEEEYQKRELERKEMEKVRAIIAHAKEEPVRQEPYQSREQLANQRIPNSTGILSVIREKRGFKEIFEEKEGKRGV